MSRRSSLLDGFAYAVLNELLAGFQGTDGYAKPAKYEVIITTPKGYRGSGDNASSNIFGQILNENPDDARKVSMEMSQASFPGMTLETMEDTNI